MARSPSRTKITARKTAREQPESDVRLASPPPVTPKRGAKDGAKLAASPAVGALTQELVSGVSGNAPRPLRALVMCFFPAFVPPKSGGEMRLLNLYKNLSSHLQVDLLTSSGLDVAPEIIRHTPNFTEYRAPKGPNFPGIYAEFLKGSLSNDVSGVSVAASIQCDDGFMLKYLDLYQHADIIIHDFPFTITADIFFGLDIKPRVYASHNAEFELAKALFPGASGAGLQDWVAALEKRLLDGADLVTYCAEGDKVSFEALLGRKLTNHLLSPNGLNRHVLKPSGKQKTATSSAVFFGSGHAPNVEAAKYIIETLAPKLPAVHFDIGGACWNHKLATPPNVTAHGLVSNSEKIRLLESASVALNPMSSGSGSNLKALEYMAFGLPILSTPFGMRGIDVEPSTHFVSSELAEFPSALKSMIDDPATAIAIGQRAQVEVAKQYDWVVIAQRFAQKLYELEPKDTSMIGGHILTLNDYDYSNVVGGGATRIRGLYSSFRGHFPVIGLCFSDDGYFGRAWINDQFVVLKVPKTKEHLDQERHNAGRFHISARDIIAMEHAGSNRLLSAIYRTLSQQAARIVIEHPYMVALPKANQDRFIYSSQNHETLLKTELLEYHPDRNQLLPAIVRMEAYAVSHAEMVVACSEQDLNTMSIGVTQAPPMVLVRNGVEAPLAPGGTTSKSRIGKNDVVFLGSAHMPNIESARFIIDKLVPEFPQTTFHFVGSICDALNETLPKNIVLHGKLSDADKSAILRAARVALNPMFSGGGSNVKMADYLAHGLDTITTPFGIRGYPPQINDLIVCAEAEAFSVHLADILKTARKVSESKKRIAVFNEHLSFEGLSKLYRERIVGLGQLRKRALYVTYRFTDPVLGGAEAHMLDFLKSLDETGDWWIDVVAPEVSDIGSLDRFACAFAFDTALSAPCGMHSMRWRRFPLDSGINMASRADLCRLWQTEIEFEKHLTRLLGHGEDYGCRWGWYGVESWGGQIVRRAALDCGIECLPKAELKIDGICERDLVLTATDQDGVVLGEFELNAGNFSITLPTGQGLVSLTTPLPPSDLQDARPLGWVLTGLAIKDHKLDIKDGLLQMLAAISSVERVRIIDQAAKPTRWQKHSHLTRVRGPFSTQMERWLESNMADYDLLIAHNPVFRPTIAALEVAKAANVPSILIPHCHIDDDYYHFPDVVGAADLATLTVSAPNAVVRYFEAQGYDGQTFLPPPATIDDPASPDDIAAFKALVPDGAPFVLVLGRKAGAKGYQHIINAVEAIAARRKARVILIGPDDDKVPVTSPHALYLGLQPRSVVRGALACCKAMCTMSQSESFGLVIVEAWAAGAPVVANGDCLAFADLVTDGETGLLATPKTLQDQLERVLFEPHLAAKLVAQSRGKAAQYAADVVGKEFVDLCQVLVRAGKQSRS